MKEELSAAVSDSGTTGIRNAAAVMVLASLLGAVAGLVLWLFLQAVSLGTSVVWDLVPSLAGGSWVVLPVCALGGCAVGLIHRRCGDYPDELETVLGRIRNEKRYDYRPILAIVACALLPLVLGASVGPEAGLAGIIAALCYWIGDNVSFARRRSVLCTELGEAATLGQLFHMPLFGLFAVEETPMDGGSQTIPKLGKIVLYGLSAGASIFVIWGLNQVFQTSMEGFPRFPEVSISAVDWALMVLYVLLGLAAYCLYRASEEAFQAGAKKVPDVLRETVCGLAVGALCLVAPMAMFSGEDQMAGLVDDMGAVAPWALIGISVLKVLMTAFCLRFGLKGGHFFPLIFACSSLGIGISMLLFADFSEHAVFAAGIITAATLGAQMKKPLAVTVLLLLCFPLRMLFWVFVAAAAGGWLAQKLDRKVFNAEPGDRPSSGREG